MTTKKFTLLQLFSIVDGRLSTTMDDIYDILNHVTGESLMTHHLPVASRYVKEVMPDWFLNASADLNDVKAKCSAAGIDPKSHEGFLWMMDYMKKSKENNPEYDVPQLKDEMDVADFGDYMVDNSILLKRLSNS